ncbi:MAG: sigma 54-interacting transcriptional regulator, partial [Rhodospirillales bacterium]|nr:sigma 54-interacting transcriptional regulator [Rhodospirillales bacterium]
VRLVCATNRNLEEAVAKGEFRADLYYRINVVPVFIPSLRERREDIPLLAEHFLRAFNAENERSLEFADHAVNVLTSCNFPGNVRELENFVYRAATMTRGEVITDIDLACQVITDIDLACQSGSCQSAMMIPIGAMDGVDEPETGGAGERLLPALPPDGLGLDDLGELDALSPRERLIRVMEKAGWVQAKAGRLLGMTPRQVGYALRKHNIEIKRL